MFVLMVTCTQARSLAKLDIHSPGKCSCRCLWAFFSLSQLFSLQASPKKLFRLDIHFFRNAVSFSSREHREQNWKSFFVLLRFESASVCGLQITKIVTVAFDCVWIMYALVWPYAFGHFKKARNTWREEKKEKKESDRVIIICEREGKREAERWRELERERDR